MHLKKLYNYAKVLSMKRNSDFYIEKFAEDKMHAVDAKFEAQKIAFAPLTFQAIRALLDLGIMQIINDAGDDGITVDDICAKSGISSYGVKVLTEMAIGMHVILLKIKNIRHTPIQPKPPLPMWLLKNRSPTRYRRLLRPFP